MKKAFSLFLIICLFLTSFTSFSVFASEKEVNIACAYHTGEKVYTYVDINRKLVSNPISISVELKYNGNSYGKCYCSKTVKYSEVPIHYMLLVDLSTSMRYYKNYVSNFANILLESTTNEKSVSIASLGDGYKLIADDLKDESEIISTINNLSFNQTRTDILEGINGAIEELNKKTPKDGEIINLVVLTDGIPYSSDDSQEQIKKTKDLIISAPEYIISVVSFDDFDNKIAQAISTVSGNNIKADSYNSAGDAGNTIAEYNKNLYLLSYNFKPENPIKEYNFRYTVTSTDDEFTKKYIALSYVKNFNNINETELTTEKTTEEESKPTKKNEKTTKNSKVSSTKKSENKDKKTKKDDNKNAKLVICCAAAGVVLLTLIIIICFLLKKRKPKGINKITLDIISGNLKENEYYFNDKLTFGTTKEFDVIIPNSQNEINAQIILDNGKYYIENLSDVPNVCINGMKIYSLQEINPNDTIQLDKIYFKIID